MTGSPLNISVKTILENFCYLQGEETEIIFAALGKWKWQHASATEKGIGYLHIRADLSASHEYNYYLDKGKKLFLDKNFSLDTISSEEFSECIPENQRLRIKLTLNKAFDKNKDHHTACLIAYENLFFKSIAEIFKENYRSLQEEEKELYTELYNYLASQAPDTWIDRTLLNDLFDLKPIPLQETIPPKTFEEHLSKTYNTSDPKIQPKLLALVEHARKNLLSFHEKKRSSDQILFDYKVWVVKIFQEKYGIQSKDERFNLFPDLKNKWQQLIDQEIEKVKNTYKTFDLKLNDPKIHSLSQEEFTNLLRAQKEKLQSDQSKREILERSGFFEMALNNFHKTLVQERIGLFTDLLEEVKAWLEKIFEENYGLSSHDERINLFPDLKKKYQEAIFSETNRVMYSEKFSSSLAASEQYALPQKDFLSIVIHLKEDLESDAAKNEILQRSSSIKDLNSLKNCS